jgi:hypothetical protein
MIMMLVIVQVVDAPFSVVIESPTIAHLGKVFYVNMRIANKLHSVERMHVGVDMCDDFVITGGSSQIIEVSSRCQDLAKCFTNTCFVTGCSQVRRFYWVSTGATGVRTTASSSRFGFLGANQVHHSRIWDF